MPPWPPARRSARRRPDSSPASAQSFVFVGRMPVRAPPGAAQFVRMPYGSYMNAVLLVMPTTAVFEAA